MEAKRVELSVINRQHPTAVMQEDQLEAILWGYYARVLKTRDRRAGPSVVGEQPAGAAEWSEEEQRLVSIAGQPIVAAPSVNKATGLPERAGDLLPNHRADLGPELALDLIIPPEDFVAAVVHTDDLEVNRGKSADDSTREWQALCFKPKFRAGANGRPMAEQHCRKCDHTWEGELDPRGACDRCGSAGYWTNTHSHREPVVEVRIKDGWSDEEVRAIKENARTLKRIVHRLAEKGMFNTKPRIDEHAAELGTDELKHGKDGKTIGFQITERGVSFADEFGRKNPALMMEETLLEAMGRSMAEKAPEWFKAEQRASKAAIVEAVEEPDKKEDFDEREERKKKDAAEKRQATIAAQQKLAKERHVEGAPIKRRKPKKPLPSKAKKTTRKNYSHKAKKAVRERVSRAMAKVTKKRRK